MTDLERIGKTNELSSSKLPSIFDHTARNSSTIESIYHLLQPIIQILPRSMRDTAAHRLSYRSWIGRMACMLSKRRLQSQALFSRARFLDVDAAQ
jgi:hypothetical protein